MLTKASHIRTVQVVQMAQQGLGLSGPVTALNWSTAAIAAAAGIHQLPHRQQQSLFAADLTLRTVSYTHLTLPTKRNV